MKSLAHALTIAVIGVLFASSVYAQTNRPIPYPVFEPPQFASAVANATRTASGEPGPNYWQNSADYVLNATINPADTTLSGDGTITYHNNSPDGLSFLVIKLRQNVHAEGVPRNRFVSVTGGLTLSRLTVGDQAMEEVTEGNPEAGQYRIHVPSYDGFTIDQHATFVAVLNRAGIDIIEAPRVENYGKVLVFRDPFGNKWDLIERH